jgi:hypothetical protein
MITEIVLGGKIVGVSFGTNWIKVREMFYNVERPLSRSMPLVPFVDTAMARRTLLAELLNGSFLSGAAPECKGVESQNVPRLKMM